MIPFAFSDQEVTTAQPPSSSALPAIVCHFLPGTFSEEPDANASRNASDFLTEAVKSPSSQGQPTLEEITEWTPRLEAKFRRLAEDKSLRKLSLRGKIEFERLMALRRYLKNPRKGEEVILEYQQRMLTNELVKALTQYVHFHQAPHRSR